jgi:hypothetical protein
LQLLLTGKKEGMKLKNTIRVLIASFLLMLATGAQLVKSVHCVFIPHGQVTAVANNATQFTQNFADQCPICAFDL